MDLVYIAKKLKESLPLEEALTNAGIDFTLELDTYRGGLIFQTERTGVFFYVLPDVLEKAKAVVKGIGLKPYEMD